MAMKRNRVTLKIKMPKYVYSKSGKYHVAIYSKAYKKNFHIGYFDTVSEAVKKRDKFVVDNYSDITKGYTPRGISYLKSKGLFNARLHIANLDVNLGNFKDIKSAINYRSEFIDSLK